MKHLSFIPSFVSRLVLIFAAITTLGVTNSYAADYDQQVNGHCGWWGDGGLVFTWNRNGSTAPTTINYSGVAASGTGSNLGEITSSLRLTNTTIHYWSAYNQGYIGNGYVYWELFKGTTSIQSGSFSPTRTNVWDGSNSTMTYTTTIDFLAKTTGAGNYTLKIYAKLTGNASNGNTSNNDNFWYNNNHQNYDSYSITFSVPYTIYLINSEKWTTPKCYAWEGGNNNTWPGVTMTKQSGKICGFDVYKCTLSSAYTNCIFSDNGSSQTRNLAITDNGYYKPQTLQWYPDATAAGGDCVTPVDGIPVMTYAAVDSTFQRDVNIQVAAVDDNTPANEMFYYCELETPMGETYTWYQVSFLYNYSGYFRLNRLIPCSDYTLTVWAVDKDGNMSENRKVVNFTTACDDGDGLYLRGTMNNWTNNTDWKFQYHTVAHDRYILIQNDLTAGTTYRYYKGTTYSPGPRRPQDSCDLYVRENAETVVFTAKQSNFKAHISSLDEIYIVGPAVNDGGGWNITEVRKLDWENPITAVWEGAVSKNGKYKLVVKQYYKCNDGSTGYWYFWDHICNGDQTYDQDYTDAILTFDLLTWSWTWRNADDNLCVRNGAPRSGLKPSEFGGTTIFQMGYDLEIYTPQPVEPVPSQLVITVKSKDWATRTGSATPVFMLFSEESVTGRTLEKSMVEKGVDEFGNKIWELTINVGDKAQQPEYSSYNLISEWTLGTCIRFSVKFPFAGSMSITTPMYYYIGQGCAPYYFEIYHHDDAPNAKAITQFDGGDILQPIIYYRKFNPGVWETLCLPFTCSAVRVYDPDDGIECELQPAHEGVKGQYWLRTFTNYGQGVERDDFKPNWEDVPAGVNLPVKDQPYIMKVPNVGGYYDDKYVMFYGKGYQNIASSGSWSKGSAPSGFYYYGNTTMWPQTISGSPYMLSADGLWFEKGNGNTLYPFEGYVIADDATTARFARMGGEVQVPTGCPNVSDDQNLSYRYDGVQLYLQATADTPVRIYSIDGHLIVSSELESDIESAYTLVPGIYVVSTKLGIYKLAL